MFRHRTFLLLAFVGAIFASPTTSRALTADQLRRVDREAADYVNAKKSVGLVVGIAVRGEPLFVRAYGKANLELGVPATTKTVFRAGSVTKQFTAAGVLLLAEQGKLAVSDKLSKYFPDFPRADEVTLAELLNHTSGIHNYTEGSNVRTQSRASWTTATLADLVKTQPSPYDFPPGTGWHYSNSNYVLLGAIIEKVSGQPLSVFMRQTFFAPLGMTSSAYDDDDDVVSDRAYGYEVAKGGVFLVAPYMSASYPGAAGRLRTTAGDLLIWERAFFAGKVVSREHLAAMTTPGRVLSGDLASSHQVTPPGRKEGAPSAAYGNGWYITQTEGGLEYFHGGDVFGYSADVGHFPGTDLTFVILTNTSSAAKDIVPRIRQIVSK
jgi:CubicO group peptidase (beta-lactamase class C family)